MAGTEIVMGPTALLMQLNATEARMLMNYLGRVGDSGADADALAAAVELDGDSRDALEGLLTSITTACGDYFTAIADQGKRGPRKGSVVRRDKGTGRQA
jgi:hypothetical protein